MWAAGKLGQWRSIAKETLDRTLIVVKFLCLLHVVDTYLCIPTLAYGPSMMPTLNKRGDVVLAERISHRFGKVGQGDLVIVKSPQNPNKTLTKRVLGRGGDVVSFPVGPWHSYTSQTVVVPKGHVWIQGDNVYASNDSRHFGPVPYGLIQGKVFWRVWPPHEFGLLT